MHLSCFSLSISLDVIIKAEKPSCSFLFFPCLFLSLCIYLSISFPFPLIYLFIFFPRFFRSLSKSSLRVHHHLSAGCSILLVVMHTSAKREGVTRASQATWSPSRAPAATRPVCDNIYTGVACTRPSLRPCTRSRDSRSPPRFLEKVEELRLTNFLSFPFLTSFSSS